MANGSRPVQFTFEIDGVQEFNHTLFGIDKALSDFSPAFELIADDFRKTEEQIFKNEGNFEGGERYAPLSKSYKAWKDTVAPGKPILTLTGYLRKSLTIKNAPDSIEKITPESLEIGTKVPYAINHQRGFSPEGFNLPVRKPMFLTDAEKKRWTRIIRTYIGRSIDTKASVPYYAGK